MQDEIKVIGQGTVVQHGKLNSRVYLMKLDMQDTEIILNELLKLAEENLYTKIFCKVPKSIAPLFMAEGFILEAYIPGFYNKCEDVFFISKFLDPERFLNPEKDKLLCFQQLLAAEFVENNRKKEKSEYKIVKLEEPDIEQITEIYREVFESYPFPIHDPDYIHKTMNNNIRYFGAVKNGELAAVASSEIDIKGKNAEMTDFATRFTHQGNNLSVLLLKAMEKEMKKDGITTLYTIARLNSVPMNKTFIRSGYRYSGTLIKNTNIAGKIESMNVYYRHL